MKSLTIKCPSCHDEFSPNESLQKHAQQLLEAERRKSVEELAVKENKLRSFQAKLKQQELEMNTTLQKRIEEKEKELKSELMNKLQSQYQDEVSALKQELQEKSAIAQEVKKKEVALEQLQRKLQDLKSDLALEYEKQRSADRQEIEQKVRNQEAERYELQLAEERKRLEDTRRQLAEVQRKAEQGSMQLQGEVQERYIEEKLREFFPHDTVQEIAKGISGADTLQTVRNEANQTCGTILYESKRTKAFGKEWVQKLRNDQQRTGASMAILVTQQMPSDMEEEYCIIQNVAVCSFRIFPMVAMLVRHQVIALHREKIRHVNKADKMNLLYDYLTGQEFRMHLEGLVHCFEQMRRGIDKKRRSFEAMWKMEEKNLERMMVHTGGIYGSIRQIAGGAVKEISLLELE